MAYYAVLDVEDIKEKFESFGFNVIEVNGHDIDALINAFNIAKHQKEMPSVIIAHTIKGKGVSFMEGKAEWHGKAAGPAAERVRRVPADPDLVPVRAGGQGHDHQAARRGLGPPRRSQ